MKEGSKKIEVSFKHDGVDGMFLIELAPDWLTQEYINAVVTMRFPLGAYSSILRVNPIFFRNDFTAVVNTAIWTCVQNYESKSLKTTK